jgi:hypothetical protein
VTKRIAVYGVFETLAPVVQRYWKLRSDGIKQRYWIKTARMRRVTKQGRYEFHGKGRDLYKAVVKAHRIMPKDYVDVSAKEFLKHPEKYGQEGSWIEKEVES